MFGWEETQCSKKVWGTILKFRYATLAALIKHHADSNDTQEAKRESSREATEDR